MANQDFYAILGVPDSAAPAEIKKAYRKLAKQYHPDTNPNNPQASEKFKQLSEAHSVLSNPAKKAKYDQMRRLGAFTGSRGSSPRGGSGHGYSGQSPADEGLDLGDLSSFGLGDIFSSIFGRGRPTGQAPAPEHVEVTISVPFRTAAIGGKVPVGLGMTDACSKCGGTGAAPGASMSTCGECSGRGTISFGQGGFAVNRPCPACRGRGKVPSERCPTCNGSGEQRTEKQLQVTVPVATETGTRVRLKGQGPRTKAGGPASDILVTFQVEPDRFFSRDGLDIRCEIPIDLSQAMLGATIQVNTIRGAKVRLKIPAGTQPGRSFRIKGHGLEKGGQHGDQIVTANVRIPEKLTPEQAEAFKEFAVKAGLKG